MEHGRVVVFTSFNLAYADRALALLESLRHFHPGWKVIAVVVEPNIPTPEWQTTLSQFDQVTLAETLYDRDFGSVVEGHNVVEACTAVKGEALKSLLMSEADFVIYLDPDIQLLSEIDGLVAELQGCSALLTPHVLAPSSHVPAIFDGELGSLQHGIFNLGFLAVRNCPEALRLAEWWADRLKIACWERTDLGIYTDQRWMDLAPVLFDGVRVSRDRGLNVASWNLNTRPLSRRNGKYFVESDELRFFHFTKAEGSGPQMTRILGGESKVVAELWAEYLSRLARIKSKIPAVPRWGYQPAEMSREDVE
jgi:hypothetical protein